VTETHSEGSLAPGLLLDVEEPGCSARAWISSRRDATSRFPQEFANVGNHAGAVQLDIGHEGLVRETSHAVF
jgi:hypothetical protein